MFKPGDKIEYDRRTYVVVSRAEVAQKWGQDLGDHLFGADTYGPTLYMEQISLIK